MLKVIDLLRLPSMRQGYVAAGHEGVNCTIKKLEIMEEPYPAVRKFLVPSEFMLTNFWSMKEDEQGRFHLVKAMIEEKCAGLGIMSAPHLKNTIDENIIELANQYGFPILYIPKDSRWGDIISEYSVLSHSTMVTSLEGKLEEALNIFAESNIDGSLGTFCGKIGRLLDLPMIMSTDHVYSSNMENINVEQVMAKINLVCQTGRELIISPITIRVNDNNYVLVYFGKMSLTAAYITDGGFHDVLLKVFQKIAPALTKELDKRCTATNKVKEVSGIKDVSDTPKFIALIKAGQKNIEKRLNPAYILYEKNIDMQYCIVLIPDSLHKKSEIYHLYQEMIQRINPDLFIFSRESYETREFLNEIEPLKYMVNTLSYLKGIYAADELPLLYMIAHSPQEYKAHLFPGAGNVKKLDENRVFLDTLRLYAVLHNITDVANLLGIHVNSVKYRVTKAQQCINCKEENMSGEALSIRNLLILEFLVA